MYNFYLVTDSQDVYYLVNAENLRNRYFVFIVVIILVNRDLMN
jgi:hypothetical protein